MSQLEPLLTPPRPGLPPLTRRQALGGTVAALCAAAVPGLGQASIAAALPRADSTRLVSDLWEMPLG